MGASATARRQSATRRVASRPAPAGRAPAPKPRPRRASQAAVKGRAHRPAALVPVAVGRTAGAVGVLADSGLVIGLTRSRLWIGLLGGLLVGIVALNVAALSFSAGSSDVARQADALERQNSVLRGRIATSLSNEEIQGAASSLGLFLPQPESVRYLRPGPDDAAEAARRLRAGELGAGAYAALPPEAEPYPEVVAVEPDPAAEELAPAVPEVAPEVAPPEAVAPEPAPVSETPAAAEAPTPAGGGGIVSP